MSNSHVSNNLVSNNIHEQQPCEQQPHEQQSSWATASWAIVFVNNNFMSNSCMSNNLVSNSLVSNGLHEQQPCEQKSSWAIALCETVFVSNKLLFLHQYPSWATTLISVTIFYGHPTFSWRISWPSNSICTTSIFLATHLRQLSFFLHPTFFLQYPSCAITTCVIYIIENAYILVPSTSIGTT